MARRSRGAFPGGYGGGTTKREQSNEYTGISSVEIMEKWNREIYPRKMAEIQERLRAQVTVYSSKDLSQEQLEVLAHPRR